MYKEVLQEKLREAGEGERRGRNRWMRAVRELRERRIHRGGDGVDFTENGGYKERPEMKRGLSRIGLRCMQSLSLE